MRVGVAWRVGCTVAAVIAVETIVCALSALPIAFAWLWLARHTTASTTFRVAAFSIVLVPSYVFFALSLMAWSVVATWATRARTPVNAALRLADFGWPLMTWVRYMAATHVVRIVAGALFRGSPVWTAYLRLNGGRIGRRVYINTTAISDHNLLELGDDAVVGADVHLSGHTVEDGILKTGTVRLGRSVTIGLGSVVDIDVEIGDACRVGAISLVPKHSKLEAGRTYAGIPVRPLT